LWGLDQTSNREGLRKREEDVREAEKKPGGEKKGLL